MIESTEILPATLAKKPKYILQVDVPKLNLPQAHGVLVLDKPQGPSSTRCISALKRLGQKKIGHAGTLDPLAQGVLLVLLGHATKISGHLLSDGKKIYKGTICLGQETDTWDAEGTVIAEKSIANISESMVKNAIQDWLGESMQEVPPYSAAKHNGKSLYKLAREGKETPTKLKKIEISQVEVLNVSLPYASFRVQCSSGTYIRSLAHSLGKRLECGAMLTELIREYSHPFGLDVACSFEQICAEPQRLQEWVQPITKALPHWPTIIISKADEENLRNGMPIACTENQALHGDLNPKVIALSEQNKVLALMELNTQADVVHWNVLRGLW